MDPNFIPHMKPQPEVQLPEAVQLQASDAKAGVAGIGTTEATMPKLVSASRSRRLLWTGVASLMTIGLLTVIGIIVSNTQKADLARKAQQFASTELDQQVLGEATSLNLGQVATIDINGTATINGALILTPSEVPTNPTTGQIYFNKQSGNVFYYTGTEFRQVSDAGSVITDVNGYTGRITLAPSLSLANGVLSANVPPAGVTVLPFLAQVFQTLVS
jgi:hypothetical protein